MEWSRRAAVAGTWYAGRSDPLAAEVDRHLASADVEPLPRLKAVIAPHAGLMYSGPVAAFSYKAARDTQYETVLMVGPSHFLAFEGVALWPRGRWETPLGAVLVDESLASAVAEASPSHIVADVDPHSREHSLELQMPFVARLWPGAQIVPLLMGNQTRTTAFALGDAIARAVGARPARGGSAEGDDPDRSRAGGNHGGEVLLVASSDLSHYEDARTAAAMDDVVIHHVRGLDPDGLMGALEREPRHACGGGPIVSVMHAARQLGAVNARLLRYADSGDVSGDKSAVVGYMAAAIW